MMPIPTRLTHRDSALTAADVDAVIVGAFCPPPNNGDGQFSGADPSESQEPTPVQPAELAEDAAALADAMQLDLSAELFALGFDGKLGAIARVATRGAIAASTVIVVGLGSRESLSKARLARAAAGAVKSAASRSSVATALHLNVAADDRQEWARALAEGLLLGAYRFDDYRSKAEPARLTTLSLHHAVTATPPTVSVDLGAAVDQAVAVADAVALARDLVNTPPQDKRPAMLAERAQSAIGDLPIEITVLDERQLADGGYGGILGVGQGSDAPPRLVELRYQPQAAPQHVALVGKGITFDSGGLSLKPSTGMETMKSDMAGAAAVLATVIAAARLSLPVAVTGVMAIAENMPSGSATRVSDVLTMYGGTTVEVINTDAEGRLVLGDAIVHASERSPDVIIDLATLTGAQVVALGERISAVIANDDGLAEAIVAAGRQTGETMWPMPLAKDEYGERIRGTIADLKNIGNRAAGVIFGAQFLEHFVGKDIAWAHLDIAGPAWSDEAYGEYSKGGTGTPVRTLVRWLETLAS